MKINSSLFLITVLAVISQLSGCNERGRSGRKDDHFQLSDRGLCAHRGAMATHPENTISAFKAAIEAGAHMIEFDVQLTKDQQLIVIHDRTVDRTTNGSGRVANLTFNEIRNLDAGSWKSPEFEGEQIPTLEEVLEIMPNNIWLNIHLYGDDTLGSMVAEIVKEKNRNHQSVLACGSGAAEKAREIVPAIMICNMDRKELNRDYVDETIRMGADFIQLRGNIYPAFSEYAKDLKEAGLRINYFGTDDPEEIKLLFEWGVDFPLVDNIVESIEVAAGLGILPIDPKFVIPY